MDALAAFLLARIAEDEAEWRAFGTDPEVRLPASIAARVLAGCDANRRIVIEHKHAPARQGCCDEHDPVIEYMDCGVCVGVGPTYREQGGWCSTLRYLALPYADHPDYREEWRP